MIGPIGHIFFILLMGVFIFFIGYYLGKDRALDDTPEGFTEWVDLHQRLSLLEKERQAIMARLKFLFNAKGREEK